MLWYEWLESGQWWVIGQWLFSWFLWLGGYGYKVWRLVGTYIVTLLAFSVLYALFPPASLSVHAVGYPPMLGNFLTSVASFHGRPFLYFGVDLQHNFAVIRPHLGDFIALARAAWGLVLEGAGTAMLGQRFNGKSGS